MLPFPFIILISSGAIIIIIILMISFVPIVLWTLKAPIKMKLFLRKYPSNIFEQNTEADLSYIYDLYSDKYDI